MLLMRIEQDAACEDVDHKSSSDSETDSDSDEGPQMHPALRAAPKQVIRSIKRPQCSSSVRGAGPAMDSASREQIEREQVVFVLSA